MAMFVYVRIESLADVIPERGPNEAVERHAVQLLFQAVPPLFSRLFHQVSHLELIRSC